MDPQIEQRLQALEKWKTDRIAQQITFPLDIQSQTILNKYFLTLTGMLQFVNSSGLAFSELLLTQDGKTNAVSALASLVRFTVNTSTNVLNIGMDIVTNQQATYANGSQVILYSTGDLPSPFTSIQPYFVVNSASGGTVIQLALTSGGSPIDIATPGTGNQYMFLAQ